MKALSFSDFVPSSNFNRWEGNIIIKKIYFIEYFISFPNKIFEDKE